MRRMLLFLIVPAVFLGFVPLYPESIHQKQTSPVKNYNLIVENDRVRVGHVVVKAKTSEGLHAHPYPRILVCIQGATIEVTRLDGTVERTTYKAGDARYQTNTDLHEPVNVGDTDFKGVIVELKQ